VTLIDLIVCDCRTAAAFSAPGLSTRASTQLEATDSRRAFISSAASAAALATFGAVAPANANREFEGVGLLGGGTIVDVNNANVRVYLKMPGMYPSIAGKIVTAGPFKTVADIYNIPGLSGKEKEVIKKYESRFTVRTPSADYVIDKYNNGLYR